MGFWGDFKAVFGWFWGALEGVSGWGCIEDFKLLKARIILLV